jgi:hypothetical protein
VQYINSAAVCQQPSAVCANASTNGTQSACLLAEYSRLDPDAIAGAGAETGAGVEAAAPAGRDYGISVILPAVLASVGEYLSKHRAMLALLGVMGQTGSQPACLPVIFRQPEGLSKSAQGQEQAS